MPSYVIKLDPALDLYVYWSTVVEAPLFWGDAAELTEYLVENGEKKPEYSRPEIAQRIARANQNGSSAIGFRFGYWDDTHLIYQQEGMLPRSRLHDFLASFNEEKQTFDTSMLEPFEDEDVPELIDGLAASEKLEP
jgi:hypothetical protein